MSNHFHILVSVPPRDGGDTAAEDASLPVLLARLEAAVGGEQIRLIRKQIQLWEHNGAQNLLEAWRVRQAEAMYSLSEYMKRVKQRFTRWYNRRTGRRGILWEDRYKSTIVQNETRALRTIGTYIDLNPVRAGLTGDPGTYRWSGYTEAMSGSAEALEGLARITGATAERVLGRGLGEAAPIETAPQTKRRRLRALVHYRHMLGLAGRVRVSENGTITRRGVSEKVQARLASESGVQREQCLQRIRHFTEGVILGSRAFINEWFERNRAWFRGRSSEMRRSGARKIGKDWKELYNLRTLRQ